MKPIVEQKKKLEKPRQIPFYGKVKVTKCTIGQNRINGNEHNGQMCLTCFNNLCNAVCLPYTNFNNRSQYIRFQITWKFEGKLRTDYCQAWKDNENDYDFTPLNLTEEKK